MTERITYLYYVQVTSLGPASDPVRRSRQRALEVSLSDAREAFNEVELVLGLPCGLFDDADMHAMRVRFSLVFIGGAKVPSRGMPGG